MSKSISDLGRSGLTHQSRARVSTPHSHAPVHPSRPDDPAPAIHFTLYRRIPILFSDGELITREAIWEAAILNSGLEFVTTRREVRARNRDTARA